MAAFLSSFSRTLHMNRLTGAAKLEFETFCKTYEAAPDEWFGFIWNTDNASIELGRRQVMSYALTSFPSREAIREKGQAAFGRRVKVMQVTIRDIQLEADFQKQGFFTALIEYLLKTVGAVQLEAVQPDWLKKRLEASPLWIRQSGFETKDFIPAYVRFPAAPAPVPELETAFKLF